MNDDKLLEILMEIKTDVSSVKTQITNVTNQLANHENRLSKLEQPTAKDDFKSELLKLLAKGIIIGLIIIGSLTGASSMITKFVG